MTKTFKEFLAEQKTHDQIEKYYAKTKNLIFVEDSVNKHQYTGSNLGNNGDKQYVADIGFGGRLTYVDIFSLDSADEKMYGKNVYRYETKTTQAGKMRPLIKIDLNKGMVYFMTQESLDNDGTDFETRGTKIDFLSVYKKEAFLKNQK